MEFTPELENNRNMEIVPPQLWSNSPTPVCVAGSKSQENEFGAAQLDITTDVSQGYDKNFVHLFYASHLLLLKLDGPPEHLRG